MKKITLFFLLVSLGFSAIAQDLKEMRIVGKAKKLESGEMVARRDQNGNYCAAIKVVSDMDGFSYDSFDGMVGTIDDNPGQDIVYLTATERVLEIFKTGYKPLKIILSDLGIVLKAREMWQLEIAGNELISAFPVTFRYTPADASLKIDGKPAATTATQSLALGEHSIKLEKDGYQAIEETITVSETKVFFEWTMEKAQDAALQIETTPEGATIYLDDVKLGESPIAAFYKPDIYPIRITKEGYVPIENQTIEVKLPQTRKSYTLEENVGFLTVNTHPGATVYFNEQIVTNPKNVKLAPQLLKIKVTMPKAETLEHQVVLKRNDKLALDMFPVVKTGTLQIAVTPFDAKIELTGDAGEKFTSDGMKIFEDIPVGTYSLKVSAAGYTTVTETAIVKQGEPNKKTINLVKQNAASTYSTEKENQRKYHRRRTRFAVDDFVSSLFVMENKKDDPAVRARIFYNFGTSIIDYQANEIVFSHDEYVAGKDRNYYYSSLWDSLYHSNAAYHKFGIGISKIVFADFVLSAIKTKDHSFKGIGLTAGIASYIEESQFDFFFSGSVIWYSKDENLRPIEYNLNIGAKYNISNAVSIDFEYVISDWSFPNDDYVNSGTTSPVKIKDVDNIPDKLNQLKVLSNKNYFRFGITISIEKKN